jgi:branched-chain amino acid transport system substrate-binding protein
MHQLYQKAIEVLCVNIELFFQKLDATNQQKPITELDKIIICQSLLGYSRQNLANIINVSDQSIRDRLSKYIYPRIAELFQVEQEEIAGNWVMILNLLLEPTNNYRLNPPPQLNNDNFQGSFGRQVFLYPPNQDVVKFQLEGMQFYQQGLYYQAFKCFICAWKKELEIYGVGNPEILIYINNCLIAYKQKALQEQSITTYTLAVVVPFYHNQGAVAGEILRGVAQIQLQVNLPSFDTIDLAQEINLNDIRLKGFSAINQTVNKIALQILIVNDPNNLYAPYNQTAENLIKLADELNIIAVIGHYSSEMTKKALHLYAKSGLVLINSSSTSNELSQLSGGENLSFFRLTTQDDVNAQKLVDYFLEKSSASSLQKVAIIYNKNSSYSNSYKNSIQEYLSQYPEKFVLIEECSYLSEKYYQIQTYLEEIKQIGVDIIVIIPDGGIEPNSLNNVGLISRLNINNCMVAGSATFYHENILHWIDEQSQSASGSKNKCQIIACIPWHWQSQNNGCNSNNTLAQNFCEIGNLLWGKENLTWRSATAFDAVLTIFRTLEKGNIQDRQALLIQMNQYFKEQHQKIKGVTGNIQFNKEESNRINPPAEIVGVKWDSTQQRWKWSHLKSMQ